ncbi:MAG: YceI family protein [Bacteroidia bacterium]|nr:YceI family protein [Bacteroidia bacterium]
MSRKLLFLAAILFVWSACTQAPQAPQAEVREAQNPTSAVNEGTPFKLSTQSGKIIAIGTKVSGRHEIEFPLKEGEVYVDQNGCVSSGRFIVSLADLKVLDLQGMLKEKLESHLRSGDFFLVDQYPEGVFEVTGCKKAAGDTLLISGNLTLRGKTKNIEFPAVVRVNRDTLRAVANFNINRQEWGIAYKGKADDLIRDEVNISLDLMAQR